MAKHAAPSPDMGQTSEILAQKRGPVSAVLTKGYVRAILLAVVVG